MDSILFRFMYFACSVVMLCGCRPSRVSVTDGRSSVPIRQPSPPPVVSIAPPKETNPWRPDGPPRDWQHIVIHHTASETGSVEAIDKQHLAKGWRGIGYHFLIGNGKGMGDGEIEATFRWREQIEGAHAGKQEYNQQGVGICLVGNFDESHPTEAQLSAVKRLVATLKREYSIPQSRVIGHRDVKSTACPGRHFPLVEVAQSGLVPVRKQASR